MSVFLLILKIIGIVLLCIIGLILFIILYVLLAPFWFKLQGSIDREMNYSVKVKACTFLHFIQVHVDYLKDGGLNYNVSILGTLVRILPRKNKDEESEDDENVVSQEENEDETAIDINETEEVVESEAATTEDVEKEEQEQIVEDNKVATKKSVDLEDIQDVDVDSPDIVDTESEDFEERFNEGDRKFFIKVREFFDRFNPKKLYKKFKEKIEELKKHADKIYAVIFDEANKEWLGKVKKELKKVIKSLGLNMRGTDLDFSLGSPDTTGQVSGVLALFPPVYDKKVRIIPDFVDEELYFDGDVYIKGKLQLVFIVIFALAILLDSNTKRIINEIKQLKN